MTTVSGFGILMIIFLLVGSYGFFSARNKSKPLKELITQKFVILSLAFIFTGLMFFQTYVPSYSDITFLDKLNSNNLNSIEEVAELDRKQTEQIESLKIEVNLLRKELRELSVLLNVIILVFFLTGMVSSSLLISSLDKKIKKLSESKNIELNLE